MDDLLSHVVGIPLDGSSPAARPTGPLAPPVLQGEHEYVVTASPFDP